MKSHPQKLNVVKRGYIKAFLWLLLVMIAVNWAGQYVYTRIDLTSDGRFSLAPESIRILNGLHKDIEITVYLKGDFPAGFKQLQKETKEMLDEFAARSPHIHYRFVNPSAAANIKKRNELYRQLMDAGLSPTNLQVKTKNGMQQQIIFPGAVLRMGRKEMPLGLLESEMNIPPAQVINHSIENLEFRFMHAIQSLTLKRKPAIAFLQGHGELNGKSLADILQSLEVDYQPSFVKMKGKREALLESRYDSASGKWQVLPRYSVLVVADPGLAFSEADKLALDQYVMYGGKILWLIDPVLASMDSIRASEQTVSIDRNLDLQELLFTYGVRLNKDLILDLNAAPIPVHTGQMGNQPQIEFLPWYYDPVIIPQSKNPIVKNLNGIRLRFASSIDTIRVKGVKKTVLLRSSPYTGIEQVPGVISLSILRQKPNPRFFSGPARNVAVLLEGHFPSDFNNRLFPGMHNKRFPFKKSSLKTAMLVVSDGDIIRNQLKIPEGYPLPLGYDQFTRQTYGNKAFILNAISYLSKGPGLISLRKREIKLRLLDKTKINNQRLFWQLVNVTGPLVLIVFIGLLFVVIRKKKYSRKK